MRFARILPLLLALLAAARPAAAADTVAPTISSFSFTDCEGNYLENASFTSTGVVSFRVRVRDQDTTAALNAGMGLRVGRTAHVGGNAGPTSLVVHLHMDEGLGAGVDQTIVSTAPGSINPGLTSANLAACASPNGHTGLGGDNCYVFDGNGSNDFIKINASPTLNSTTDQMTLQAWIYPSNTSLAPILEWNNGTSPGVVFWHSVSNAGDLFANLVDTTGANHVIISSGGFVKANEWQLVTLTFNGSVAKLYHNHVSIASFTITGPPPMLTNYNLFVGRRPSALNAFAGRIDEVRVFNQALSDNDIEADFYSGVFSLKSTSTASVLPTRTDLVPATHYSPAAYADGGTTTALIDISSLALRSGSANTVTFSFQDKVGNTRRVSNGITVVESVPDTPLLLAGSAPSVSQLDWSWTRGTRLCKRAAGTTAGAFKVYRASDLALLAGPQTTTAFTQTLLGANTLQGLRVSAIDDFGESPLSSPTSAYTQAADPTGPTIGSISTGSAVFSWSSTNQAYTRFEVSLSTNNFATVLSTRVPISNDLTGVTTGLVGLSPQTTYYIRVRALNGRSSDSDTPGTVYSGFASATFATLPAAPGSLSGNGVTASAITWSWTAVPTATSYTLRSSTGTDLAVTGALSFTVNNLSPNASYGAALRANNPSGSGSFGDTATAFTLPNPPTGTAVASVSTATARLTWNANGNPGGTSFQVQVSSENGFTGTLLAVLSVVGTDTNVTGLLPASTYYARVRASGFSGSSSGFDAAVSFVTDRFGAISSNNSPASPYDFPAATVGAWHFDESSGTSAADSTSYGNHGTLSGVINASTPVFTTGMSGLGNALRFAGLTGGVVQAAHSASLATTGDLTVEAWVLPGSLAQVQDAGIVVKGTGAWETFMLDVSSTSRWRFGVRNASGSLFTAFSTQTLRLGAWTHVVGVYLSGGSPSLSIYVDGTLSSAMTAPASRLASTQSLSIGNRRTAASSFDRAFNGTIDEVHVLTSALNAAQVAADTQSSQPSVVAPASPNQEVRITVPPNAFGSPAVLLISSSPLTVPITVSVRTLTDGLSSPPTGQTLVPSSLIEVVANVGGVPRTSNLGSMVTLGIPYPDTDGNGLVDGTSPAIPAENLRMYTLNTAVTRWEALPSTVDLANKRVLGQTSHFSIFALFGPTGIKPNTDQVRLYPRPWKPGSGGKFDSVSFAGRTGLAIDNLPSSGNIRIFTLSGELVRELLFNAVNVGTVIWDGTNASGRRIASGVYFAYVRGDDGSDTIIKFAVER
ncbi:MAG: fibronectin type III domain-containing protein [Elusimicrobia bacterium]|nr:fibronectin type III domain-containing protein [Elusimicrobiota bacterium]